MNRPAIPIIAVLALLIGKKDLLALIPPSVKFNFGGLIGLLKGFIPSQSFSNPQKLIYRVGGPLLFLAAVYVYKDNAIGTKNKYPSNIKRIDGHLPIVGSMPAVLSNLDGTNDHFTNFFNKHKVDVGVLSMPLLPSTLIINDAESLEYILNTNFDNYIKGEFSYARLTSMFGKGIFNTDGKMWYIQRKLAVKIFTTNKFREMFESAFPAKMEILVARINKSQGDKVDLYKVLHQFFLDSFGAIAFGINLDTLSGNEIPFVEAFEKGLDTIFHRFLDPFWSITERIFTSKSKHFAVVREFGMSVIQERRSHSDKQYSDLLQLVMDYRDEDGNALDDNALIDQVINFIIAGRDTTAETLSWLFYNLDNHPEVVDKVLKEVDEVVGVNKITYDHIKKLEYAKAVFKETLRLYPPVSRNSKNVVADDVLPNGAVIRKGDIVTFSSYAMGRSPKIWGPDAMQFKPERWIDAPAVSNYQFPAFNAGPRLCIGKTIAELQGVFVFVSLLREFDIRLVDRSKVKQHAALTLPMKDGMQCTLRPRINRTDGPKLK